LPLIVIARSEATKQLVYLGEANPENLLTLTLYAGFSPAYPMKGAQRLSSKKEFDFKDFKDFDFNVFPPPLPYIIFNTYVTLNPEKENIMNRRKTVSVSVKKAAKKAVKKAVKKTYPKKKTPPKPKRITFDDLPAIFAETDARIAKSRAETDARMARAREETEKAIAESEARIARVREETEAIMAKSRAESEAIIAKSRAETDAKLAESGKEADARIARSQEKTDKALRKLSADIREMTKAVGHVGQDIGELMEFIVIPKIRLAMNATGKHTFNTMLTDKELKKIDELGEKKTLTEVDVLLYGDTEVMAVETKSHLVTKNVRKHIERLDILRQNEDLVDIKGKKLIGAVIGAIVDDGAKDFALKNGLYVVHIREEEDKLDIIEPDQCREW